MAVKRDFLPPLDTAGLSKREIEVLALASDMPNSQIARALGISPETVTQMLKRARDKYELERALWITREDFDPMRPAAQKSIP